MVNSQRGLITLDDYSLKTKEQSAILSQRGFQDFDVLPGSRVIKRTARLSLYNACYVCKKNDLDSYSNSIIFGKN